MTGSYSIATVAQLTGVPSETLRTWERRYGAVSPERTSGGQRRYSADDVDRLRLLSQLVARGERISTIANLGPVELAARLDALVGTEEEASTRLVVSVHGTPPRHLDGATASGVHVEIAVGAAASLDLLLIMADELTDPATRVQEIRAACGHPLTVVAYTYLPEAPRRDLPAWDVRLLSLPRLQAEIRQSLVDFHSAAQQAPRPAGPEAAAAPRFTTHELERLVERRNDLACACPQHALMAFEAYSRRCANDSPHDASLHRALAEGTGRAREEMEGLLVAVCEHDGIELFLENQLS